MELKARIVNLLVDDEPEGGALITFMVPADRVEKLEYYTQYPLTLSIKRYRKHRSLGANALLWRIIDSMAVILKTSPEEVYEDLLRKYGEHDYVVVRPEAVPTLCKMFRLVELMGASNLYGERMEQYRVTLGSSHYDVDQMQHLLEQTILESDDIGGFVPTNDEVKTSIDIWRAKND